MQRVAVDANVLIAARLSKDQNRERGRDIVRGFDTGELPAAYVFREVLEEVVNYQQARSSHERALETLDAVVESRGFELEHTSKRDLDRGRSVFRKFDQLSLTDAVIVAAMRRRDVEYLYSFDDGFDGIDGVRRLTTAENPFDEV